MLNFTKFVELLNTNYKAGNGKDILYREITPLNIDDIFRTIRLIGIDEVIVDDEQMITICQFLAGNNGYSYQSALKILIEGKVDKFLGIKLITL